MTAEEAMRRWPRLTAHVIASSLGYATPTCAANIILDAKAGRQNWCEWIWSCFDGDARKAVERAIRNRHTHTGFIASYKLAWELVRLAAEEGREPVLASWY